MNHPPGWYIESKGKTVLVERTKRKLSQVRTPYWKFALYNSKGQFILHLSNTLVGHRDSHWRKWDRVWVGKYKEETIGCWKCWIREGQRKSKRLRLGEWGAERNKVCVGGGGQHTSYSSWTWPWSAVLEFEVLQLKERKISHLCSSCLELCLNPDLKSPSTMRLWFRGSTLEPAV